uniref:Uncharacterized protein n=1 Tax=Anguilla anguilla TaxID=7936 RepID=A0A0E9W2L5_ANGAN
MKLNVLSTESLTFAMHFFKLTTPPNKHIAWSFRCVF